VNLSNAKRIIIIGSGGSGKSTLARKLHNKMRIPLIHLDKEYWKENWTAPSKEEWIAKQLRLIYQDSWIIDGKYSSTMDIRMECADTIIFLDINRCICIYSVLKRWISNIGKIRPDMGNGCKEKIDYEFIKWIYEFPKIEKPKIIEMLKKYYIETKSGEKLLMRVANISEYKRKKTEFELMKKIALLDIPMCLPIKFGTNEDNVYILQSWIDGEDAADVISFLSDAEQYAYGLKAGEFLKKIHSIPAPKSNENWELYYNRKLDTYIEKYNACEVKFVGADKMIKYVNENRYLLKGRPQSCQHGDYHIGNMIIDKKGNLFVIDFNRLSFGDPWEDLNRLVWCAHKSSFFATGMVNGYFDNEIPVNFWRVLALYIAGNTIGSMPWAIPFGQGEIEVMIKQ